MHVTAQVASMGHATVGLLEVLAGSWVSVLQTRRRTMCLLEHIYAAQCSEVVRLAAALVQELWGLVIIGPCCCG
jgi:hypothetical protein